MALLRCGIWQREHPKPRRFPLRTGKTRIWQVVLLFRHKWSGAPFRIRFSAACRRVRCCCGPRYEPEGLRQAFQRQLLFLWMLWTVNGIVLGAAACTERIYTQCQIPPVLTPPDSWTSVREHPWEGICKEPFILQWRGNLIITREFLQVPGSTEWTLPGVAGWNAANTNTMEALKKAERLSTHSPCLFSPEMKGGLQVSRNCAFWLVFIDSEVLADRRTDRETGREGFHYSDVVSFPLRPRGFHC